MAKENERLVETVRQVEVDLQQKSAVWARKEEDWARRMQELEAHFRQLQGQYDKERAQV